MKNKIILGRNRANRRAGGLARASRTKLAVGPPQLAAARRVQRLSHSGQPLSRIFWPDHGFRIYGLPFLVVGGYPRFRYQGYWFSAVDPWPEYWANDWYDTDDVYVTHVDNGYYLFNRRYPDVGIAINISM